MKTKCCDHTCNEGRRCPYKTSKDFKWLIEIIGIFLCASAMILFTAYVIWKIF